MAYNNLTFVRSYIPQLLRYTNKIILIDNNSTYPPLLEYYETIQKELGEKLEIRRKPTNLGHTVWKQELSTLPPVFVLSDPDLELNAAMPSDAIDQLLALSIKYNRRVVGLALDISEPEKLIQRPTTIGNMTIFQIESKYWTDRIPDSQYILYNAPIDTTFCLINTRIQDGTHIRVAGNFTCKHLPWYTNYLYDNIPTEEFAYWRQGNISSCILTVL
jgi:hypothetical protein